MGCSDGFQDKTSAFERKGINRRMARRPAQLTPSPFLRCMVTTYKEVRDRKAEREEELTRAQDTKGESSERLMANHDVTSAEHEGGRDGANARIADLKNLIVEDTAEMEELSNMLDIRCRWENIDRSSLGLDTPSS